MRILIKLVAVLLALPLVAVRASAAERISIFDTGSSAPEALTSGLLARRDGWTRISRGEMPPEFRGDAVMTNGRVLAVLRQRDAAVELYSVRPRGTVFLARSRARLRLHSASGEPAERLQRVAVVEYTRGAAGMEASFATRKGNTLTARFRLKRGEISVNQRRNLF